MKLSIHFNWPLGQNAASIELAGANIEDAKFEFRLGVVPGDQPDMVYWHESEWVTGDRDMSDIRIRVKREDTIVVDRRRRDSDEVISRNKWNVAENWPPEAHGASMTIVPWHF
jgi:hypothetical protein